MELFIAKVVFWTVLGVVIISAVNWYRKRK